MFVCAWSFDVQFGRRDEVLRALEKFEPTAQQGWKAKTRRILVGSIGAPETRLVIEHEFESLADLEASWDSRRNLPPGDFESWVTTLGPLVVPGSPRWEVYRIVR